MALDLADDFCLNLISRVIKLRVAIAFKRHESSFFSSIKDISLRKNGLSEKDRFSPKEKAIIALLPSRRSWPKANQKLRANKNSSDILRWRILKCIERDVKGGVEKPYLLNLSNFIDSIKNRIEAPGFSLAEASIAFVPKGPKDYRSIATLSLSDNLIVGASN